MLGSGVVPGPSLMATTPFPTNQTATVVNSAIDGVFQVIVSSSETAAIAALDAAAPFFALPVISTLTDEAIDLIVQAIGNAIYQDLAQVLTFGIIDFQVNVDELPADQAALVALKSAQEKGDPVAIQSALVAFAQARGALTLFDGSASPGSL